MKRRQLTARQRQYRSRKEVQKRLAELPVWDGTIHFISKSNPKNRTIMTPEQLHAYKADRMAGFDDLPAYQRRRLAYSANG